MINRTKIAFITSLFGEHGNTPGKFQCVDGYDYFLFSDRDQKDFDTNWDVYNISNNPNISNLNCNVRKSRYAKFMGWELLDFMGIEYDAIFYCDAHYSPNPQSDWHKIAESMQGEHFPLIQGNYDSMTNRKECELIVRFRRDSLANISKTISFFKKQYPHVNLSKPPYYKNTALAYLSNDLVKSLTSSFWKNYITRDVTFRDQPLWNVLLSDRNLTPMIIKDFHLTHFKLTGIYGNHFYK